MGSAAIESQKDEVNAAKDDALQAIQENEQSAITNFNKQRVTPEMLSESTKQLIEASGGGTITNLADDEDITSVEDSTGTNVLKLANRAYNPSNFSGKGYKILRKNIQDGKNVLTQEMINEPNTIYEIRYDFDLNGDIVIPDNSRLIFKGGSLSNGTITGNFTVKYPKGNAIYKKCIVEKININDFIDISSSNNRYSIDNALITIINSFKNTQYRSNIDIEFSQGIFYTIQQAIEIPARFNLIGVHGNAFIHILSNFEEPTPLFTITSDSDSSGYINNLQYIKNIVFYNEGTDNNIIVISLKKGYVLFENISFYNAFYRCIKSDAYTDNVKFDKIILSGSRESQDYPNIINFELGQGEGKYFNNISDGGTIKLSNGTSCISNCINLNIIAISERLQINSCVGETGIIHLYSCLCTVINTKYVNAALAQSYIFSIDDNDIREYYFSKDNIRYAKTELVIINSQFVSIRRNAPFTF